MQLLFLERIDISNQVQQLSHWFLLSYAFCYYCTYPTLYHKTFLNLSSIFQCSSIKSSPNRECTTSSATFCFSTLPQVGHRSQLFQIFLSVYFCLKISAAIWLPLPISSQNQAYTPILAPPPCAQSR